jgi:hypothetical protein
MLVEDLQKYHRQFESIKIGAQNLLEDPNELQFNWQPSIDRWSIAQCIDHLVVTGRSSLSNIHRAINEARSKGLFSSGPIWTDREVVCASDGAWQKNEVQGSEGIYAIGISASC